MSVLNNKPDSIGTRFGMQSSKLKLNKPFRMYQQWERNTPRVVLKNFVPKYNVNDLSRNISNWKQSSSWTYSNLALWLPMNIRSYT